MGSYEYGNARLRAMKSRLLGQSDYQRLAGSGSLDRLLTELTRTEYREAIETSLVRYSGLGAIYAAMNHNVLGVMRKVASFFDEADWKFVAAILQQYDVHNVKSIMRGLSSNVPPDSIRDAQLPIGELTEPVLAELNQASSWRAALDLMVTMRLPMAQPLLATRSHHPHALVPEYELALDQWYFAELLTVALRASNGADALGAAAALEADISNLLTVLRLVHAATDRVRFCRGHGVETVRELFVGPGYVSLDSLEQAANQVSVEACVKQLEGTRYGEALVSGLAVYLRSRRLSDIERQLRRYRLQVRAGLVRKDPLGIGVFLGYLALKVNEVSNLRWVAHGVDMGIAPNTILEGLEVPS